MVELKPGQSADVRKDDLSAAILSQFSAEVGSALVSKNISTVFWHAQERAAQDESHEAFLSP
ncbi:hypothetical protein ACQ3I4_07045 [Zafaria sp. Z1313]|uniref:hypothetical protein n=1 Tax=Zafaria sp. J156 TaxID=3116490 RepID=UPI002E7A7699|nr:hypothetical protein [Zafaria sp. J156]MEE1620420.1 hypothetical protein [Zafaria sp. J156]